MADKSNLPLDGRHAVVTGAARGIGAAIAARLEQLGVRVTLMGRDPEALRRCCDGMTRAQAVAVDVGREAEVERAFREARTRSGPVHILINNAGSAASAPLARTDLDLWQQMLHSNLTGVFLCTRAVLAEMREQGWGRIVTIASTAGLKGYAYAGAYCAAKHGAVGLTRALALETALDGITVNAICPGYTETDLLQSALDNIMAKTGRSAAQARAELARVNPQNRFVQPGEVAASAAWLCLPGSESITGQAIAVAGGEV